MLEVTCVVTCVRHGITNLKGDASAHRPLQFNARVFQNAPKRPLLAELCDNKALAAAVDTKAVKLEQAAVAAGRMAYHTAGNE
jgi:hypothetical protein